MRVLPISALAALSLLSLSCHGSPIPERPYLYPELVDRSTGLGAGATVAIGVTMNQAVSGYSSDLDLAVAETRVVTYPELTLVATSAARLDVSRAADAVPQFRRILTPSSPLQNRWYAVDLGSPSSTVDIRVQSSELVGADGHYYVRFRPDSYPVVREVLFVPTRGGAHTVYLQVSEPVQPTTSGDEPFRITTSTGAPLHCEFRSSSPMQGGPFTIAADCDAYDASSTLTVTVSSALRSAAGMPVQNIGINGHPTEFQIVPSRLTVVGNIPVFAFPD